MRLSGLQLANKQFTKPDFTVDGRGRAWFEELFVQANPSTPKPKAS